MKALDKFSFIGFVHLNHGICSYFRGWRLMVFIVVSCGCILEDEKNLSHVTATCFVAPSPLDVKYLYDRALNILWIHHIQNFILNACESVHDNINNNGPNLKLNNMYVDARMNWTRNHVTLKFNPSHINAVLVEK